MTKTTKETGYDFDGYKKDSLIRPRDVAWGNWAKFEKVGDRVQGFIADVFFKPAADQFPDQRGITLKQVNGELINVVIKRLPFVLAGTDNLRIGDPLTVELIELKPNKGKSDTKIMAFYGKNLSTEGPTVAELDLIDQKGGGSVPGKEEDGEMQRIVDDAFAVNNKSEPTVH